MSNDISHVRTRWPDAIVPPESPTWLHYEIKNSEDVVTRTVEVFADGRIARNSIEIEERSGVECPSLIEDSVARAFDGVELEPISAAAFDLLWDRGEDTPFWNVRFPPNP